MIPESEHLSDEAAAILRNPAWWRAWTLTERLEKACQRVADPAQDEQHDADLAARKLQRWKRQAPFGQSAFFAERLEMDTLSEEELLFLLGESPASLQSRLPEIAPWLRELALAYGEERSHEDEEALLAPLQSIDLSAHTSNGTSNLAFLTAIFPLFSRAIKRLQAGIIECAETYPTCPFNAATIHTVLAACLPDRLLPLMMRTLTLELHVARLEDRLVGETPQERLQYFIEQLQKREEVLPLLEEYAPLARSVLTTLENWTQCSLEFLHRLCADWSQICQTFSATADPGQLVEVNGGAGDLHKGGQSTLVLRFSSDFRLIYRPKPMAVDVHFQELLRWLNERGAHLAFRVLNVLDCGSYGWAEFVSPQPCTSREEVARFYERQGGYLALLYALEATDVHFENLIAAGEHPVMIDLEALFHPRAREAVTLLSQKPVMETLYHSVLRIGLLPLRVWGNQEHLGVDISGLGGHGGQLTPQALLHPDKTGTDQMRFIRERMPMPESANRPTLHGQSVNVLEYRADLLRGFERVYRLLLRERAALLNGPIQAFAHDEIRFLARATNVYAQLWFESYHPDFLRNALDRDRFFDRLWAATERRPELKPLIPAERADLHAGDIPMFTTRPQTRDIFTSKGACLPDYLDENSLTSVKKRLQRFDEQDLTRQRWFIEASLATILLREATTNWQPSHLEPVEEKVTRADLLRAVRRIADRLVDLAIVSEHGASWIVLAYVNEREWRLQPTNADLYDGISGIILFLAYAGALMGEARYTETARVALLSVQEYETEMRKKAQDFAIGSFLGWGALIYLYAHLGALWGEQTLLSRAHNLALILPELIEQDSYLDLASGAAGCLLALLAIYRVAPSPDLLELASRCGDHMLHHAEQCGGEPLPIRQGQLFIPASRPLTGLSHGAAGMALSLLQLAETSGEIRFREGAQRAMDYERSVFSEEHKNWPDFRLALSAGTTQAESSPEKESFLVTWCHGAPGIGLARLASLPYQDDACIREEIKNALQTTLAQGFGLNHSLCHGDLGNLDVLLTAARTLDDPLYHTLTQMYTARILRSIEKEGWLTGIPLAIESPSLMTGIAGIGYQLLRLANPERVPAVLTLAPPIN